MRTVARLGAVAAISAFALGAVWIAHGGASGAPAPTSATSPKLVSSGPARIAHSNPPQSVVSPPARVANPASPPGHQTAAQPRPPTSVFRTTEQALINQDRARYGLAPLTWSSCLSNVAVGNARRMARQEFISHTNGPGVDLSCGLGRQAGENVGYWSAGVNDTQLNTMFMNSPDHRANILGPYHYVATAWAVGANGFGYIAVEFS
ncbi:MAG TPA: CAP domain-containing protein [Candidatus Dormibacteraeota bacterium]|nr:CAP domain-containing protein [Candidatus Dormibacteraeota bacterium]